MQDYWQRFILKDMTGIDYPAVSAALVCIHDEDQGLEPCAVI